MANGFVKLSRGVAEHAIWTSEPFTRGQAWVDLIMLAAWKDSRFYVRGNRVDVKRGQLGYSILSLADRWKWSRGKVKRFLNELQKDQQIDQQNNKLTTLITITNYEEYQGEQVNRKNNKQDSRRATDGQQTDTLEEVKEVKEVNKGKKFTPPSVDEVRAYCLDRQNGIDPDSFVDHYSANGWMRGKTKIKDWKACVRTWEKNKQPEQELWAGCK